MSIARCWSGAFLKCRVVTEYLGFVGLAFTDGTEEDEDDEEVMGSTCLVRCDQRMKAPLWRLSVARQELYMHESFAGAAACIFPAGVSSIPCRSMPFQPFPSAFNEVQ